MSPSSTSKVVCSPSKQRLVTLIWVGAISILLYSSISRRSFQRKTKKGYRYPCLQYRKLTDIVTVCKIVFFSLHLAARESGNPGNWTTPNEAVTMNELPGFFSVGLYLPRGRDLPAQAPSTTTRLPHRVCLELELPLYSTLTTLLR